MRLIVFSNNHSSRLQYTLDLVFKELLGLEYQLVSDQEFYKNSKDAKINYSIERVDNQEVFIPSTNLLFEKKIELQQIEIFHFKNLEAFFKVEIERTDFPFDLFALVFYLVSRYEEYLPFKKDIHERFAASQSLAFRANFLKKPLANLWVLELKKALKQKFPLLSFKENKYQFQVTYDIDYAWAYRNKGFIRSLGAYLKNGLQFNFREISRRAKVQMKIEQDPYFTFDYLESLQEKYYLKPIYFFLLGDHGKFDKNISHKNSVFKELIISISKNSSIGIHPSYQSNFEENKIQIEKERLEDIVGNKILKSRQHFLKLTFPDTYRRLLDAGIKEDYTMGYADQIGFRASIASPFYWYDLKKEEITDLKIHPFQIMEVTLRNYLKLSKPAAIEASKKIILAAKEVDGMLTLLWHNNSLSNEKEWEGWRKVHEDIVEIAMS